MQGTGCMIWKLADCLPVSRMLDYLRRSRARWVSIKAVNGLNKYNQINSSGAQVGNDVFLLDVIRLLHAEGYEVGGWGFIFPLPTLDPAAQGRLAVERINTLGLAHWLIDAEQITSLGAYWKVLANGAPNPDRKRSATLYMDRLVGMPQVGLCSYRYPSYHTLFPFKEFVNHAASKVISQQMYWVGSHNPAEQLALSMGEYNTLVRGTLPDLPFAPIGSAYAQGAWMPTAKDLHEFIVAARTTCLGWGFWSLDYVIKQQKNDWVTAIAEAGGALPGEIVPARLVKVKDVGGASLHSLPAYGQVIGNARYESVLPVVSEKGDSVEVRGWLRKHDVQDI